MLDDFGITADFKKKEIVNILEKEKVGNTELAPILSKDI